MKSLTLILNLLLALHSTAQTYEYVYKNQNDSSYNCYLKVLPENTPVKGMVIRDYSRLPDSSKNSPYQFTSLCTEKGLLTLYTVSSDFYPEFFVADSVMDVLDQMVTEVIKEHAVPEENIFIGGISASGTRALRYAQYCAAGKSASGIKIKGVFAVDSPLDLARFYRSVENNQHFFKAGMKWEANLMSHVFPQLFSGSPAEFYDEYKASSVFTHNDSLGGNAHWLQSTDIIIWHEPDIDWWLEERGCGYYDINSFDITAFVILLRSLGNRNVELITTTEKGFDHNGVRNCHSWTIVDEKALVRWIVNRME